MASECLIRTILAALKSNDAWVMACSTRSKRRSYFITDIHKIVNSVGLKRLGSNKDGFLRPLLQIMTRLLPNRPINLTITSSSPTSSVIAIPESVSEKLFNITELQNEMQNMHIDVANKSHSSPNKNYRCTKQCQKYSRASFWNWRSRFGLACNGPWTQAIV